MSRSQGEHWSPEDYQFNADLLTATWAPARPLSGTSSAQNPVVQHASAAHATPVLSSATTGQKRHLPLNCQVEGCGKDLSGAKDYYQRYKFCEVHLKLSSLIKDGLPQRFCQQCGRFHLLAEFDGDKRSCRARLDDHNHRRRKRLQAQGMAAASRAQTEPQEVKVSLQSAGVTLAEPKPPTPPPHAPKTRRRKLALQTPDQPAQELMQTATPATAPSEQHAHEPSMPHTLSASQGSLQANRRMAAESSSPGASVASEVESGQAGAELMQHAEHDQKSPVHLQHPAGSPDGMLVRYLSDPHQEQWAGQATLPAKADQRLGQLPGSLDWSFSSKGGSGLIGAAAHATAREQLAQGLALTEPTMSVSAARSLTSMRSVARASLLSSELADGRFHSISDPQMGMPQSALRESVGEAGPPARRSAAAKEAARQATEQVGMPDRPQAGDARPGVRSATWPNNPSPLPDSTAAKAEHGQPALIVPGDDSSAGAGASLSPLYLQRHPSGQLALQQHGQLLHTQSMGSNLGQSLHSSLPSAAAMQEQYMPPDTQHGQPTADARAKNISCHLSASPPAWEQGQQPVQRPQHAHSLQQLQQGASLQSLHQIGSRYRLFERARTAGQLPYSLVPGGQAAIDAGHVSMQDAQADLLQWDCASPGDVHFMQRHAEPHAELLQQQQQQQQHAGLYAPQLRMRPQPEPFPWQGGAGLAQGYAPQQSRPGTPLAAALQRQAALGPSYAPDMQPYDLREAQALQAQLDTASMRNHPSWRPPRYPGTSSGASYAAQLDARHYQQPIFHDTMDEVPMQTDYPLQQDHATVMTSSRRRISMPPDPSVASAWQMLRVSAKLGTARPDQLPPDLRQNFLDAIQSSWAEHTLQGSVRPGCTNLILGALEPGSAHGPADAAAAAVRLIASNPDFWREQLITLQLPESAAVMAQGIITHHIQGKEMDAFQPPPPIPEALAYGTDTDVWVAIPAACLVPASVGPLTGLQPCSIHLLGRKQGRLIFDLDLMLCPSLERVLVPTDAIDSSGLLWLEIERDAVLSRPVPILMATDIDVAEEVLDLEENMLQGRMSARAVEQLLLKIGSVLEFAEPFLGYMPSLVAAESEHASSSPGQWDERLGSPKYLWAMVACARYLLAECCKRSWPAVAAKVVGVAAIGCKSFGEVVASAGAHCAPWGGLLCTAVRQGCLSTAGLLMDLQDCCGFEWDLSDPKGEETALHVAARLDDEGCMAGLLLTRCPQAQQLWSSVANAQGETPASIVLRLAASGRQWSYLSPAERAAAFDRMQAADAATPAPDSPEASSAVEFAPTEARPMSPMPSLGHEPARRRGSPPTPYDLSVASDVTASPTGSDRAAPLAFGHSMQAHEPQLPALSKPVQDWHTEMPRMAYTSKVPAVPVRHAMPGMPSYTQDRLGVSMSTPPQICDVSLAPHWHDLQWQRSLSNPTPQPLAQPTRQSMEQLPTPFAGHKHHAPALYHTEPGSIQQQQARPPQNPLLGALSAEADTALPLPASLLSTFGLLPADQADASQASADSAIYDTACSHIMHTWDAEGLDSSLGLDAARSTDSDERWAPIGIEPRLSDDLTAAVAKATASQPSASGGLMHTDLLNLRAEDNSASSSDLDFEPPAPELFTHAPLASPGLLSPNRPQASAEFPHPFDTMESLTLTGSLTALKDHAPAKRNLMDSAQELALARRPARSSGAPRRAAPAAPVPPPASKRTSAAVLVGLLALAWSGLLCNRPVLLAASCVVLARAALRQCSMRLQEQ